MWQTSADVVWPSRWSGHNEDKVHGRKKRNAVGHHLPRNHKDNCNAGLQQVGGVGGDEVVDVELVQGQVVEDVPQQRGW